jgi:hypothetical protein
MGATMAWTFLIVFILVLPAQSVAAPQQQDTSRHLYDRVMENLNRETMKRHSPGSGCLLNSIRNLR